MDMFPQGAGGHPAAPEEKDDGKMVDLREKIDTSMSYAKNEAAGFPMSNLFIGDSRLGCKSDADEQMIIHIEFQEFVKIRSIKFIEYNNGVDPESHPTKVNLYVNRTNLGFEDCDDVEATQTLQLTDEDLKENGPATQLKYVKYQRVKSLTIFIEENQGGDVTCLGGLNLFGRPVDNMNMADFKKQSEH